MAIASVPPARSTKAVTSVGFDDVAGFARLVEPFLCRLFCLLGFVLFVCHGCLWPRQRGITRNIAIEVV